MRQDGLAEGAKELCHQNDFFSFPLINEREARLMFVSDRSRWRNVNDVHRWWIFSYLHSLNRARPIKPHGRWKGELQEQCPHNKLAEVPPCNGMGGGVHDGTVQQSEAIETGAYWNRPSPQEYVCLCVKLIYSCLCGFFCSFFPTSYCEHFKMHINMDSLTFYSTWCSMCLLHPLLYLSINPTYF